MLGAFTIDVVSDVVCPWCYIGKRRLEAALARLRETDPDLPVEVRWHPFQLNPDVPPEGIDRRAVRRGEVRRPERARAGLRARGRRGRRRSAFRSPSTRSCGSRTRSTRTGSIAWAQTRHEGDADALVEALFRAYFSKAATSATARSSCAVAAAAGYDPDDARAVPRRRTR